MAIRNKTELLTKFATPIWITRLVNVSTLNKKLLKFFYEQKKLDPEGIKRSSIFGWHSKDYQEKEIKKNEPYRKFFNKIRPCIQQISDDMGWNKKNFGYEVTSTWGIINPPFASNASHIHSNNLISAAYYVKWPKNGGRFVAQDPRNDALYYRGRYSKITPLNEQQVAIQPETGLIAMFPSFLRHWVEPNMSNEDRVIISFNINYYVKGRRKVRD